MSDSASAREVIERLVKQAGIRKKLAVEILHIIPEIIEEGLKRDGEVRVKGLGTFRMKWVRVRIGRNPKTGERVEIPAHNRLVFLPEQSFKEYINRDFRLLSYKIIPSIEQEPTEEYSIPEPEFEPLPEPEPEPQPQPEPQPEPEPEPERLYEYQFEPAPQPQFQSVPESPPTKRRIHWIVPVAVSVIVILSLIFYFRNCDREEDRSQKSEVGSSQSAVPSQQPVLSAKHEGSAVGSQQSAIDSQKSTIDNRQLTIDTPTSTPSPTRHIIAPDGKHLFKLAREVYGNPYLWVLIYQENQDKISDPDLLISGKELVIPALEGTPDRLTRNDSLAVSEGYRLLYEYFKAKGDPRTDDFFKAMKRYKPL